MGSPAHHTVKKSGQHCDKQGVEIREREKMHALYMQ
jgi:hypothetical protein